MKGSKEMAAGRRLSAFPVLSQRDFVHTAAPFGFPMDQGTGVSYWYGARTALRQGILRLRLSHGDRVLVPAYACGSEIDTLVKCGLVLDYYKLLPDLTPDLNDVERLCVQPARALFIIHYFGFAQPMDPILALADEHGLLVLEDNAHGLFSEDEQGRPLGSLGDMGVMSFTKALPMPDGGALLLNARSNARDVPAPGIRPEVLRVAGRMKYLLETSLVARFPHMAGATKSAIIDPTVQRLKRLMKYDMTPSGTVEAVDRERALFEFKPRRGAWRMSTCARFLLKHGISHQTVVTARRRNFSLLLSAMDDGARVVPLNRILPPGCSPLFFPVLLKEGSEFRKFLSQHGVESHRFGFLHEAIPVEGFPFETNLKQNVLGLPIHQGLTETDMLYLAELLNRWNKKTGVSAA